MAQLFLGIIGASFALGGLLVVGVMMVQDIRKHIRNRQVMKEIQPQQIWNAEKKEGIKKLIQKQKLIDMMEQDEQLGLYQETLEEAKFRIYKDHWNIEHTQWIKSNFLNGFEDGAKWQQEQIGKSEFLQKLRATMSDAEARRLILETFKNK